MKLRSGLDDEEVEHFGRSPANQRAPTTSGMPSMLKAGPAVS
ncbi:MAG: hypothetical protein QXS57_05315 [Candidatus Caldarchaeum sp.]